MKEKKFAIAVKCLIRNKNNDFLILEKNIHESTGDKSKSLYDIPGGRVEYKESLTLAIQREVKEETSLIIDDFSILDAQSIVRPDGLHLVVITYLASIKENEVQLSNEHCSFLWLSAKQINTSFIPSWIYSYIQKAILLDQKKGEKK